MKKKTIIGVVFLLCMAVAFDCFFGYKDKVYAAFQDEDIVTTDLKLTLGNVDLEFNNPDQISKEYINLKTNNEAVRIQVPEMKNQGNLDGKIFYRIDLYQMEEGEKIKVPDEMINHPGNKFELTVQSNGIESNKVTSDEVGDFLPVLDKNSQSLILQSDEMIQIELFFSSNNMNHVDGYKIELTYLMMQTNGTLEKPMFHDEITMSYEIKLDRKNSFWSEGKEVKTVKSFRYAIELSEAVDSISGKLTEVEKGLPNHTKDSLELSKELESSVIPKNEENSTFEGQKESPYEQTKEQEEIMFPTEKQFKYFELTFNEEIYNIGFTQSQFNWLLNFKTVQEFSGQLTEDTPPLYVKYNQVTGIEDIEQFVYQLAEEKQLDFEIKLKDIPEQKLLEITFTK